MELGRCRMRLPPRGGGGGVEHVAGPEGGESVYL